MSLRERTRAPIRAIATGSLTIHGPGSHGAVELAWVERGALAYQVGRRTLDVRAGSAVMIPADVEHAALHSSGTTTDSLWLDRDLVDETAHTLGRAPLEPEVLNDDGLVVGLASLLRTEVEKKDPGWPLAVDALTDALLVAMLRSGSRCGASTDPDQKRSSSRDPRIAAAIERIEDEYAESLTIDELARTACMSRYHFSRCFRDDVGESPHKFLVRVRLERAAERLRAGVSVTEAAFEVGFGGLGRFSRAFRERFGVLPSRYPA